MFRIAFKLISCVSFASSLGDVFSIKRERHLADDCPEYSVVDETGYYCCPDYCGECGGTDCDLMPGGEYSCCPVNFQYSCHDGILPCIITDDSSGTWYDDSECPDDSIIDETGKYCCPSYCGECGGEDCYLAPGGEYACCWSTFRYSCYDGIAPCILSFTTDSPTSAPTSAPSNLTSSTLSTEGLKGDFSSISSKSDIQSSSDDTSEVEYVGTCSNDGIIAAITVSGGCYVEVCCASTCSVCDTSDDCTDSYDCCAKLIAETISVSDVDVSCRNHDPPCVIAPEDDPCSDSPCQNGAPCGYAWQGNYLDNTCTPSTVCECDEIGDLYTGEYCEIECEEGETPCGYYKYNADFVTFSNVSTPNDVCCGEDEECFAYCDEYASYATACVLVDRPSSCRPNPCLNGGECYCHFWCECSCEDGYEGALCETLSD